MPDAIQIRLGMKIPVLPNDVQTRTFDILVAVPLKMGLKEAISVFSDGSLHSHKTPFADTLTYDVNKFYSPPTHYTSFYISRPIFGHRDSVDTWLEDPRAAKHQARQGAITFQGAFSKQEVLGPAAAIKTKAAPSGRKPPSRRHRHHIRLKKFWAGRTLRKSTRPPAKSANSLTSRKTGQATRGIEENTWTRQF
ncbi:MAG: hypothetical protein QMB16_09250 [Paracoccaceae bacterium]